MVSVKMGVISMINPFKSFAVSMGWTCRKHVFVLFRHIKWYEIEYYRKGYRSKLVCRNCNKMIYSKIDFNDKFGLPL
ncbi:hypothetical protein PHLEASOLO_79 [Escherichia phage vB_ EcoD_Phleasolo]|nr:hypothetical protein PHLEASOLO_79 [Escherichia phage vB_ EcoD_Phleasolo]